jgi:hypothetical protein
MLLAAREPVVDTHLAKRKYLQRLRDPPLAHAPVGHCASDSLDLLPTIPLPPPDLCCHDEYIQFKRV